jgi:hypothetical protein
MLAFPPSRTTLLPCTLPLPAASLQPSPLLLPRACLLLRAVRQPLLMSLLGALPLLDLLPLLLDPLLPRLDLLPFPLPILLLFRPALSFVLLVALRVHRDHRPEKQKQGRRTGNSNKLHIDSPFLSSSSSQRQHGTGGPSGIPRWARQTRTPMKRTTYPAARSSPGFPLSVIPARSVYTGGPSFDS